MSQRQVFTYEKNWMAKVQPGVPFALVDEERADAAEFVPVLKAMSKRNAPTTPRKLKHLGELYTIKEVAQKLKCSSRIVYEWTYEGRLRKTMIGAHIRIAEADLEAFLCA